MSEDRQSIPTGAADSADDEDTSSNSSSSSPSASQGEMLDVLVRSTQRSASISTLIGGVSAVAAAAAVDTASADTSVSSPPAATAQSSDAAEDEDLEAIAYNINGSVIFNGGSYSLGPEVIEVPEADQDTIADYYDALEAAAAADAADVADADEDEQVDPLSILPFSTVVIEQALVAAGDKRLRLVATLKLRRPPGQELDIEVSCAVLCCTMLCYAW